VQDLQLRLADLDGQVSRRAALREDRQKRLDAIEKEILFLTDDTKILESTEELLIELGKRTVGDSTETLNKLATLGLGLVFPDQQLELKTTIDRVRGKTGIRFDLYDRGKTYPISGSYGGGVLAIVGFLLRVSLITSLKMRRILLLDESFAHVAVDYIPQASKLLRKVAEDLGFTIIMVTHQPEFAQAAHVHVRAKRKAGVTTLTTTSTTQSTSKEPAPIGATE